MSRQGIISTALIGREAELDQLDALVTSASAGEGSLLRIAGPAGIGKSALLRAAIDRGRARGFQALSGVGNQLERDLAFGLLRHLFGPALSRPEAASELLVGAARLAQLPLGLTDPGPASGFDTSSAMHGMYWLAVRLAERSPLLLAVDDAHWSDPMSLRCILYLARRLEGLPILILIALRDDGVDGDPSVLAELEALPNAVAMAPGPLTLEQTGTFIDQAGLDDRLDEDFHVACHSASGGNPFLLSELVRRLQSERTDGAQLDAATVSSVAPEGVVRWVNRRLRALGDEAADLASAYAVLEPGVSLGAAGELAGIAPAATVSAADRLIAAGILGAERPYGFVHPLVRAAVYDSLSPARRAAQHRRAASLAAERGAGDARVAAHLLYSDAGQDEWVVTVLRRAAAQALATGAPPSAATYLSRALQERIPRALRAELLTELGAAQEDLSLAAALGTLGVALELEEDPHRRARIHLAIGRGLFANGEYAEAREAFLAGRAELGDSDDDLCLELAAWAAVDTRFEADFPPEAKARFDHLLTRTGRGETRIERLLLAFLAFRSSRTGERSAEVVTELARRALADGALLADCVIDFAPYGAVCSALFSASRHDLSLVELDRAVAISRQLGGRRAYGWLSMLRGITQYGRGALLEAIADLEEAGRISDEMTGRVAPEVRAFLGAALVERDDLDGAARVLTISGDEAAELERERSAVSFHFAVGRLRTAEGRLEEALAAFQRCEPFVHAIHADNPAAHVGWRTEAAVVAARLGRPEQGAELLADTVARARAFGAGAALGQALRAQAWIEGGEAGIALLREAIGVLEGTGSELHLARTLADLGAALRRTGRRREALGPLRRALDLATRCGGLAVAGRAGEELVAAGARPRRQRITGTDALTASEARVATMAAGGATNARIAQDLFVTQRTVETHLTSVYRKLDIGGRDELQRALEQAAVG